MRGWAQAHDGRMSLSRSKAAAGARCLLRDQARAALRAAGIQFSEILGGGQFLVQAGGKTIDLWPGSGRWRPRAANLMEARTGGVQAMIQYIQQAKLL